MKVSMCEGVYVRCVCEVCMCEGVHKVCTCVCM